MSASSELKHHSSIGALEASIEKLFKMISPVPSMKANWLGDCTDKELLDFAACIGTTEVCALQSIAASLFLMARHMNGEIGDSQPSKTNHEF